MVRSARPPESQHRLAEPVPSWVWVALGMALLMALALLGGLAYGSLSPEVPGGPVVTPTTYGPPPAGMLGR